MSGLPYFNTNGGFFFLWFIWYWANISPGVGSEAYFRDVNNFFGTGCTTWTPATTCTFTYTHMAFALHGTEAVDEEEPEPEPDIPAVNYPNHGEVLISVGAPVVPYAAPGEYAQAFTLPADYDGNGFDTYIVTGTATVGGATWYSLWVGGEDYLWVPASQVQVLR